MYELVGLGNAHAGTNAASVVLAEQVAEQREVLDDGRRVGDLTEAVDNLVVTVTIGLSMMRSVIVWPNRSL